LPSRYRHRLSVSRIWAKAKARFFKEIILHVDNHKGTFPPLRPGLTGVVVFDVVEIVLHR
jgi:hypothetical protein